MTQFSKYRFPVPETLRDRLGISIEAGETMRKMVKEMNIQDILSLNDVIPNTIKWYNALPEKPSDVSILMNALSECMGDNKGVSGLGRAVEEGGTLHHTYIVKDDESDLTLGVNNVGKHFWISSPEQVKENIAYYYNKETEMSNNP